MIRYKKGANYQLYESYVIQTRIVGYEAIADFLYLDRSGKLYFTPGFCWNGVGANWWQSLILTREKTLRPSMVHDALCGLLEAGKLPQSERPLVDLTYYDVCADNNVPRWKANIFLGALLQFGDYSPHPVTILEAP